MLYMIHFITYKHREYLEILVLGGSIIYLFHPTVGSDGPRVMRCDDDELVGSISMCNLNLMFGCLSSIVVVKLHYPLHEKLFVLVTSVFVEPNKVSINKTEIVEKDLKYIVH